MNLGRVFIFIVILFVLFQPNVIKAEELSIKNEFINPGSFYYSFKRVWEKGLEKLQFSPLSKINFSQSQLKVRLAELQYVVENDLLSEVQKSSERISYQAGKLTDELISENKDKESTAKSFQEMQKFLEKLRDKYPSNSSFWMLIQHSINSLGLLSEKLK